MVKLDLFKNYYEANDIIKADLVIKNLFNRNIEDSNILDEYLNFKLKVSSWNIDIPTRKIFIHEAENALIIFSENVELTEETVDKIEKYKDLIHDIKTKILADENLLIENSVQIRKEKSINALNRIVDLKEKLALANCKDEFNKILLQLKNVESIIETDLLSKNHNDLLIELTKDITDILTNKLQEFEKKEMKLYNLKAVESFKSVYSEFISDEKKYNNIVNLKKLCKNGLFDYDVSKLFYETNIYYNQIYTYILGKVNDEAKFELTKLAVNKK
ncbi:hypothetical protein FDB29_08750 [Clostridium botulinum]|nr:hypothetical protein [Clostridium botulinum]